MKNDVKESEKFEDKNSQEAKAVVDKLILAAKNTSFYPRDHAVAQNSVDAFYRRLQDYTEKYGALVLEISKNEIFFQGKQVYSNPELENNLAYLCFRDGIKWLSFSDGIEREELVLFFNILKSHRVLEEESKGDIVTSLWEEGLVHLKYSTTNEIWKNEELLDISSLKAAAGIGRPEGGEKEEESEEDAESIAEQPSDAGIFELSAEDLEATRELIEKEESRDFDKDVLEVLLIILQEQRESEDFAIVLEIIKDSFKKSLAQGEFYAAEKFLARLAQIREEYRKSGTWALAHLEDFFLMISGPQVLTSLSEALSRSEPLNEELARSLERLLKKLRPEAVTSIVQVFASAKHRRTCEALMRAMKHHAAKDPRPLIHLARQGAPETRRTAVMVMSGTADQDLVQIILEAAGSDDASIRKAAVSALAEQDPPLYEYLLPFIKDPEKEIRRTVFNFLMNHPNNETRQAVLNFLADENFTSKQQDSLLMLYKALAACAGDEAAALLSSRLFAAPLHPGKLRQIHRTGAAIALASCSSREAENIIEKASRSLWPSVRRAAREARRRVK